MEGEDEVGNVGSEHMNVKQKMGIMKTLKLRHGRNGKQSKTVQNYLASFRLCPLSESFQVQSKTGEAE
jgi:hypothetical protein